MSAADEISPVEVRGAAPALATAPRAAGTTATGATPAGASLTQKIAPGLGTTAPVAPASGPPATLAAAAAEESDLDSDDGAGDGNTGNACTVCGYRKRYEKERDNNTQRCSAVNRECTSSPGAPGEFEAETCTCTGKTAKQKCTAKSL